MTKITVVQIAYTGKYSSTQYLDDQGRVWYDSGRRVIDPEDPSQQKWRSDWKQIDLPEEPQV